MPTDEYWRSDNSSLIEELGKLSDHDLVDRLWTDEDKAWEYVLLRSVIPVLKRPFFYKIIHDRNLSSSDVQGMVYDELICHKKLALFEFRCPVVFWIRHYVAKVILNYCKNNPWAVSDNDYLQVLDSREAPETNHEEVELAQKCFSSLWKQNPMRAYVHMLKVKNEMSARDIMSLLNISSENNVNKIFERAISDMVKIRRNLSGGDSK